MLAVVELVNTLDCGSSAERLASANLVSQPKWLVSVKVITYDCLSYNKSSILLRVAKMLG